MHCHKAKVGHGWCARSLQPIQRTHYSIPVARSWPRDVRVESNLEVKALEAAVQTINGIMNKHQKRSQQAKPQDSSASGSKPAPRGKFKTFSCKSKAAAKSDITEPDQPQRALHNYLSLPVDQYNLLDPRYIQREEGSRTFVLKVPLQDVLGIDLQPQISITVDVDPEKGQVVFTADQFTINDPRLQKAFDIEMCAVLASKPLEQHSTKQASAPTASISPPSSTEHNSSVIGNSINNSSNGNGSTGSPSSTSTSRDAANTSSKHSSPSASTSSKSTSTKAQSAESTTSKQQTQSAQQQQQDPTHSMTCNVDVAFTVTVPPPLSIVPRILLSTTGSLIAKLTIQALLPQFLELLAVDYQRWARGEISRAIPAGSLVPAALPAAGPVSAVEDGARKDSVAAPAAVGTRLQDGVMGAAELGHGTGGARTDVAETPVGGKG